VLKSLDRAVAIQAESRFFDSAAPSRCEAAAALRGCDFLGAFDCRAEWCRVI